MNATKLLEITALHDLIGKYYATPVSLKNTLFTRLHVIPNLALSQINVPFISK